MDADRLRFDFTHFSAMTPEEISQVEHIVNEEIRASLPVETQIMTLDEAKKKMCIRDRYYVRGKGHYKAAWI